MSRRRIKFRETAAGPTRKPETKQARLEAWRFYASVAWRRLRGLKLSLNPLCERCEANGVTIPTDDVHHIEARTERPDLALELSNLESLCDRCHTLEENARKRRR